MGKPLSESQAYLPEAEAPPPRQDRSEDWVPSVEDWINTIGLNATPPRLAKQQFEARQSIKTEPKLSPLVALSLPASWFQRVVITAKNLKLSQSQILELAYHLKHFVIHKAFDNESERWKYRLCIAIKLIKEGRWSCPKGLESQRTRHQESAAS